MMKWLQDLKYKLDESEPIIVLFIIQSLLITVILLAAFLMSGCSSGTPQILVKKPPVVLTIPCPPLQQLPQKPTLKDLVLNHIDTAEQYMLCKNKHTEFINWFNEGKHE